MRDGRRTNEVRKLVLYIYNYICTHVCLYCIYSILTRFNMHGSKTYLKKKGKSGEAEVSPSYIESDQKVTVGMYCNSSHGQS